MLITDTFTWDFQTFEAHVEGMCAQIDAFPHERVALLGHIAPETILALFAIWKVGKIACPLSTRLPSPEPALSQLETELFIPTMPKPQPPISKEWNLQKPATFLFTSGSSGKPKIACHTLANHLFSAQGSNQLIPLEKTDRWALTLPLFHVGGLGILFRCYLAQCSILLNSLETATHISMVPTQLLRLQTPLPNLKTILLGGAPLPDISTPWNILPTYGMTEMSSQIVTGNKIHPHAELKIAPDKEIWVRGPVLFQGYLENNEIHLPLTDGWFATKDLGEWRDGKLHILGRKDNLFISGGENIQPEEIEAAIRTFCHMESIVVPFPDPEFGARPAVFLPPPFNLPKLQAALLPHLPKYKIPIRAFPLPPQTSLKPNRKELAQLTNNSSC